MRIAYVCYWNCLAASGVTTKIATQAALWRRSGHDVTVFCLTRGLPAPTTGDPHLAAFFFETLPGRQRATRALADAVRRLDPDVVYLRYDLFLPPLYPLVRRFPTVVEVNSSPAEHSGYASWVRVYYGLNARAILGRAAGVCYVTAELATLPLHVGFRRPALVLANGIDLDAYASLPPAANERPRLAFSGTERLPWHGLDKIIGLARSMPDADFEILGLTRAQLGAGLPANLVARGPLPRAEYEPILARCDVGLGTLALHRKRMREASPLKVREYLAYGLPVITAHEDPDFPGPPPWFVLRLPNHETNVADHVQEIRAFVQRVRGSRVPRMEVEGRIGSREKEGRRLAFMAELAGGA